LAATEAGMPHTTPSHEGPSRKVNLLLVDDQPDSLLALDAILYDLGANLVMARSGEEALRHVENDRFAAILLDVRMPGLHGLETARRIRSRPASRHTPILFLSADVSPATALEAYAIGAIDYLVKPLVPVVLRAKVAGMIALFEEKEQARVQSEQLRLLVEQ